MKEYIPTINITSLLNKKLKSINAKNTISKIEKACVEVGFFKSLVMELIKKILIILLKSETFFLIHLLKIN